MATPTPATLEEFRAYLKNSDQADTSELLDTLEGATEAAEGWHLVGPIVARSFTDRVPADTGILLLPRKPVQSVTSATRISDGMEFLTADLDVDKVGGIIAGKTETIPAGDYDVVYEAGRDPVPVSLKQAVLIIAGHHWQTQQNSPTRNRFVGSESEGSGVRVSMGYLIPNRAAHLLSQHALVP